MLALGLDDAQQLAVGGVGVLLVGSVVAAWIVRSIVQKLLSVAVLVVLAFAVWTQRTALEDCADAVREVHQLDRAARPSSTRCSFFGADVTIPDLRGEGDGEAPTDG